MLLPYLVNSNNGSHESLRPFEDIQKNYLSRKTLREEAAETITPPHKLKGRVDSDIKQFYSTKEPPAENVFVAASSPPAPFAESEVVPLAHNRSVHSALRNKTADADRVKFERHDSGGNCPVSD